MTWLSRICFSLVAAMPLLAADVTGQVSITGGKETRTRRDRSGIVVWLKPAGGAPEPARPRRVTMVQKDKSFTPHVLAVPTGSTVDFPNYDPIFHNAFSNYSGQLFDVGLYPPGTSRAVTFRRPGVVRVFCNIHPNMSAVIVVLETPWFATTSANGQFRISGVPPGEYEFELFYERATDDTLRSLRRRITVGPSHVDLSQISVSEAGYLPSPHKNKYGKDYPPATEEGLGYPGAKH